MVTKEDKPGEQEESAGRAHLDKLELNKETVTDLSDNEEKMVKGGARPAWTSEKADAACPE